MASAKKPAGQPTTRAARPALKAVPDEIAARYRTGQQEKVRAALAPLGAVETYPQQRMIVVRRGRGVASTKLTSALDDLRKQNVIEFVTPVLRDPESGTRQVLTDEIVLRLKPGRSKRALDALKAAHGIEVERRNEYEPSQYIVKVANPSGTQTLDVARSLDESDDVEFASPNFLTEIKR